MPELVRLYIRQVAIGFLLSAALVSAILWFNVANLWHLVTTSDMGLLAVFLLWLFNGIVLAAVQFGITIMGMAEPENDGNSRGTAILAEPVLIAVKADNRR